MPRSRGQSIKQLSRACAAHLSLTLPGPSAAHSKLIGSCHRIANPQPTNPPTRLPNSTQAGWRGEGGGGGTNVSLHFPTSATYLCVSVRFGIGLPSIPIRRVQRGNLGWSGGGGKWGVKESFREEGPPLRLRPSPPPKSYWAIKVCPTTAGGVVVGGGGGDYFSILRDWNPQRLSSRHMVRSIPSTAAAPVTLRLRCPTHPPPSTLALSEGGNVSVLLTHCHSPPFLAFPFPPSFFLLFLQRTSCPLLSPPLLQLYRKKNMEESTLKPAFLTSSLHPATPTAAGQ